MMEITMAALAEESQIVDVGASLGGGRPRRQMMGVAPTNRSRTQDAAPIAYGQRQKLMMRGVAAGSPHPKGDTTSTEDQSGKLTFAGPVLDDLITDRPMTDQVGLDIRANQVTGIDGDNDGWAATSGRRKRTVPTDSCHNRVKATMIR